MQDREKVKVELLQRSKIFFDSIESQFLYRELNLNKINKLGFLRAISLVLFVLNLTSFTASFPFNYSNFHVFSINVPMQSFVFRWIFYSSISAVIMVIIFKLYSIYDNLYDKLALKPRHKNFAFLYKSIKELNQFLLNENPEHSKNSLKYLHEYLENALSLNVKIDEEHLLVPDFLEKIISKNNWILLAPTTTVILNSFKELNGKICERIKQVKDIDTVIDILEELLVYEYLRLNKPREEKLKTTTISTHSLQTDFVISFAKKVELLSGVDAVSIKNINSVNKIGVLLKYLSDLFTSNSILVMFFSWLTLLTVIFTTLLFLGVKMFQLQIDSTIYIGAVSGIIIGALTLTATIYSKK